MKFLIVLVAVVAMALASEDASVISQNAEINPDGTYKYAYEISNGVNVQEGGNAGVSISGSAKWVDPEGTPVDFSYTADESGYHPVSSFLPVGPPVPEIIQRAIAYIAAHPSKE